MINHRGVGIREQLHTGQNVRTTAYVRACEQMGGSARGGGLLLKPQRAPCPT